MRPPVMRKSVVLPQPEGPRMTTNSPVPTARLVGASAWTGSSLVLNHLSTPASTMAGCREGPASPSVLIGGSWIEAAPFAKPALRSG